MFAERTRAKFTPDKFGSPSGNLSDRKGGGPCDRLLILLIRALLAVPQGVPKWTQRHCELQHHSLTIAWCSGFRRSMLRIRVFPGLFETSTPMLSLKKCRIAYVRPPVPQKSSTAKKSLGEAVDDCSLGGEGEGASKSLILRLQGN